MNINPSACDNTANHPFHDASPRQLTQGYTLLT